MISRNSLDARVIEYLLMHYPVTVKGMKRGLRLKENTLYLSLNSLRKRNIIRIEPAGGDIFITLLRRDFSFYQQKRQHRKLATARPKRPKRRFDHRIYG